MYVGCDHFSVIPIDLDNSDGFSQLCDSCNTLLITVKAEVPDGELPRFVPGVEVMEVITIEDLSEEEEEPAVEIFPNTQAPAPGNETEHSDLTGKGSQSSLLNRRPSPQPHGSSTEGKPISRLFGV